MDFFFCATIMHGFIWVKSKTGNLLFCLKVFNIDMDMAMLEHIYGET